MNTRASKSHDLNIWQPPVKGLDFDIEGPTADHLIDASHIYDQVVYQDIRPLKQEWTVTNETEADAYLPIRKESVQVTLGVDEKKTTTLPTSKSVKLDDYFQYKKGYVINTGGSIWGLDFVPKSGNSDSDPTTQYLAIGGYRGSTEEHIAIETIQPTGTYKNAIQIWRLKLSVKQPSEDALLDLCLLHDFGVIYDLKWCPYGAYEAQNSDDELYKLGILSFACGDGTIRTLVVPHPDAVRKYMCPENIDSTKTVYLKINSSRCTFSLKPSYASKIAWGGHKKIAAAYLSGAVGVWNMESALRDKNKEFSGRHLSFSTMVLDAGARDVAWNGIFEPEKLVVCGNDGQLQLIDTNDPFIPLIMTRIRNILGACDWSGHNPVVIMVDSDGINRAMWVNEDGGTTSYKYGVCPGFCWSVATSEHHGQYALCTSLGYVKTTNLYQVKVRGYRAMQCTVYKLHYDENTQVYRYIDGLEPQAIEDSKKVTGFKQYGNEHMAIQRVVWNPNRQAAGFIASGGAAGLCRVEFDGRGSKWA